MLIYSRILGEAAPEAFHLTQEAPTVADLLAAVGASRNAFGRRVELHPLATQAAPATPLADLGIGHCDLVTVRAIGEPKPSTEPSAVPAVDTDALRVAPDKRRLSEYEEVTRWTQWEPPYHIDGDRPAHQVWDDDSTVLACADWNAYRTPDKLYYRTYTTKQSRAARAVETAFDFADKDGQLAAVGPARVALLRQVVGALQYPDWGLCVVHQQTTRFALSSWIAGATCFMMFDDLRHAQLYGHLALAYGAHFEGFDDPRPAWTEHPRFQSARRVTEELMATLDWGKAVITADLLTEPLLTTAAHALLTRDSLAAGDGLTPFVCRSIAEDKARHRDSAAAFLALVAGDEKHGTVNRELIGTWAADLLPRSYEAAVALAGSAAGLGEPFTWITRQLAEAGIEAPAIAEVPVTEMEVPA
jgi:hypothetical protein